MQKSNLVSAIIFILFTQGFDTGICALTFDTYTDRTAWENASESVTLDDFSDEPIGRISTLDFGDFTGTSSTSDELYQPYLYSFPANDPAQYINIRVSNLAVNFDYSITAFAFDWRNTSDPYQILYLDIDTSRWSFHNAADDNGYNFFGVVARDGGTFDSLSFDGNSTRYKQIANFTYTSSIPEPSSLVFVFVGVCCAVFFSVPIMMSE